MPIPPGLRKMRRSLVREDVYRLLHEWIVNGTLQPDEQMRDVELAEMLGVSRTPVREALRRLEDEGLVQTSPNRWTRVAPVSVTDAHNHFPILWALERLALELTETSYTHDELDALTSANETVAIALRAGQAIEASTADFHFHQLLLAHCPNSELTHIIFEQKLRLRRISICYFEGFLVAEKSIAEHRAVVDALQAGNKDRAAQAIEGHWRESYRRFLAQVERLGLNPAEHDGNERLTIPQKVGKPTRFE